MEREKIEEKYKWDLTEYFKDLTEWENLFSYVKNNYSKVLKYENKLNNKNDIFSCLEEENDISSKMELLYIYASLKSKENSKNSTYQNLLNKIEKLSVEIGEKYSFIDVELNDLDDEFLKQLSQDKDFKNYDLFFLDIIKNKKHMLSKKEEKLLAKTGLFSGQFSSIFDKIDTADIKFDDVLDEKGNVLNMNNSVYSRYIQSADRTLRKNAFISMNGAYGKLNHTITEVYLGNIKADCFYSQIRNFKSCLDASMYAEDVDINVYKTLVFCVNENLSIFHKYFELKRKILGVDKIAVYDMRAPSCDGLEKSYSYEQAFDIVLDALKVLGDDYVDVLKTAQSNRWIDVFNNDGKDTGAFSWGAYRKHPVVLLNFEGILNDVFTLAHELGHSMHTYYSNNTQVRQKAGYEIFVAEVASTVNEMLLVNYFMSKAKDNNEKLYYLDYLFKMFYSTIFRQTLFAEFEEYAHSAYEKGDDTTAEGLNAYYYNLNQKYFGKDVELVDEIKYEWSRIPHFYTSFYVYKYATGLISAFYIANKIFSGDTRVLEGYRKFLTLGNTLDPVSLLKIAGVDLTNKQTFDYVFSEMNKLLETYKSLI